MASESRPSGASATSTPTRSAPTSAKRAGASQQRIGHRNRASAWMANHQLVAVETLIKLIARPLASLLTWLVIAIALTLPGALWMAVDNLQQLSGRFQESGRMTAYLATQASQQTAQELRTEISRWDQVSGVTLIDADQALADFRQHSGLEQALELLPQNPLPHVLLVEPPLGINTQQLLQLSERLQRQSSIASVQLDMAWVERLLALLALGERVILVLGALLALAILLVVGNTIRLAIAARVDEIRVVKLVGGTNAYVRRPFLYTGLWYGMVGGLLSWGLLGGCWFLLVEPVSELASLYGSGFALQPLSAVAALTLLVAAMLLGWLGAWWSVSRHLDQIEP